MIIGELKETKDKEYRVALTPIGAKQLASSGHKVLVEKNAGNGSGFSDEEYVKNGAQIVDSAKAWNSDIVVKAKTTGIAYETVEDKYHRLPLLAPMSAVAGNMAVQIGAYYLAKFNNGKGMMLGEVMEHIYGKFVIIGDGVVGKHAAKTAYGMGANVYLFGRHEERMDLLRDAIGRRSHIMLSTPENLAEHVKDADLVVGAVLVTGAKAPYVVTEEMIKTMQPGSVIV